MDAITTWQLGVDGIGWVQLESSEFRYAGGLVIAALDGDGNGWAVFDLGSSQVAVGIGTQDQDGNNYAYYWNSHYATTDNQGNVGGMMLWLGTNPEFSSDSIGPEQTFRIANQATAGSFPGQYLSGVQGGWYPEQWGLGTGSFISSASAVAIRISGDLLPLLQITNSAYDTDLS